MFYRRRSVFYRVWLNSKTHAIFLPHFNFLTHATSATHAKILRTQVTHVKISTHATQDTHAKILWTNATHPTHANVDPRDPRAHATHVI